MRWHSAELAGTFWAVVLNGLLAEQPEQPLPWLGAWLQSVVGRRKRTAEINDCDLEGAKQLLLALGVL